MTLRFALCGAMLSACATDLPLEAIPPDAALDASVTDAVTSVDGADIDAAGSSLPAFCANYPRPDGWESTAVSYDTNGRLRYAADSSGTIIPDFSWAGYHNGTVELPGIPTVARVDARAGDATARIQAAIDEVGRMPLGANGYRGAVELGPGRYELVGVVHLNHDGVVLRGTGRDADESSNTILFAPGTDLRARVVLGSGQTNWPEVSGTRTNITTQLVSVGERSFDVADAGGLQMGDSIVVVHPITTAWLAAVHGGSTGSDPAWTPGDLGPITFLRHVAAKNGNRVTLDAPVFDSIDRALVQGYVYKTNRNVVRHAGIENLRVDSAYAATDDEMHANNSIDITGAEDVWVRHVTALHFVYAGVRITNGARITVADSEALDPIAIRTGGRMYNFACQERCQLVLFTRCHATNGRHHFVSNGTTSVSGIVFHRGISEGGDSSEGHRRWSQGLLYDAIQWMGSGGLHLGCRGDYGTGHGWAAVNSVSWNDHFDRGHATVEMPPLGQNWAIGAGPFNSSTRLCSDSVDGHFEHNAMPLRQESLYEAQLCDRLR